MGSICNTNSNLPTELHIPIQQGSVGASRVYRPSGNSSIKKRVDLIIQTQNNTTTYQSPQVRKRLKKLPFLNSLIPTNEKQSANFQQVYLSKLKATYKGHVNSAGIPNGHGQLFFDNKDFLEGVFIDGYCEGSGRIVKADGSYYQGDIKNNVADGFGIFIDIQGKYKYEGQWKKNLPNGTGQANYANGSRYIGSFLNGKKHGQGTLFQKESEDEQQMYQGEFESDQLNGKAKFVGCNGETYQGQWKSNRKHGFGIYQWPDSSKYQGWYFEGKKQGRGKMSYKNGEEYEGSWHVGLRSGQGVLRKQSTNQIIKGFWNKGKLIQILN